MSYYEELGLAPSASAEEIKEAYRALMRLLHPDYHSEPQLRRVAEPQVKKLNKIYSVLSDPERRKLYDRQQAEGVERSTPIIIHAPPAPLRPSVVNRNSVAWVIAVACFAFLLIWMASRPTPAVPSYTHDSGASIVENPGKPVPAGEPPPAGEPLPIPPGQQAVQLQALANTAKQSSSDAESLRMHLAQALEERDAALADVARLQTRLEARLAAEKAAEHSASNSQTARASRQKEKEVAESRPEPKQEFKAPPEQPVAVAKSTPPPSPAPAPAPPVVVRNPIAGSWVYQKPAVPPKNKDLYPPEFIETVITEENGQVHGTYRARYHVPNRPVSPDVSFQFAGRVSGDSGILPWSGTGGARGEVTLKLTADHALRVDWTASQLGTLGFYRGTAVLVKKAD